MKNLKYIGIIGLILYLFNREKVNKYVSEIKVSISDHLPFLKLDVQQASIKGVKEVTSPENTEGPTNEPYIDTERETKVFRPEVDEPVINIVPPTKTPVSEVLQPSESVSSVAVLTPEDDTKIYYPDKKERNRIIIEISKKSKAQGRSKLSPEEVKDILRVSKGLSQLHHNF